jgi:hypothetical protein
MASIDDLAPIAAESAFIFTGSIAQTGAPTAPVPSGDGTTAKVSVEHVIKAPLGLRGLAGREVTAQLLHPLAPGRYLFFADPLSVGASIAVKERAHFDAEEREVAEAAVERDYAARMAPRLEAAFLVALGTEGEVRPLVSPAERRGRPPWAMARFEIERVLKGRKLRRVTLVGPIHASKHLPRAPALRAGRHAILILQRPPEDAMERLPEEDRQTAAFIADTYDIQPPDRLEALERIIRGSDRE